MRLYGAELFSGRDRGTNRHGSIPIIRKVLAMTLREAFKRDFGVDLPVNDGTGTRADPAVVEAASPADAGMIAERVLTFLMRGKGLADRCEIFWRLLESGPTDTGQQRYRIEDKRFGPKTINSEIANYYFISNPAHTSEWPRAIVDIDPEARIRFPWKLGWLDHKSRVDYENRQPGLGYSHDYAAPNIGFTFYVYRGNDARVGSAVAISGQIESAMEAIAQVKKNLRIVGKVKPPTWCSPEALAVLYGETDEKSEKVRPDSLVIIDRRNGLFIKIRPSWIFDDQFIFVSDTIDSAGALLDKF